jgi:hypothetical protein
MGLIKEIILSCIVCKNKTWHKVFTAGDVCKKCGTINIRSKKDKYFYNKMQKLSYKFYNFFVIFTFSIGVIIVLSIIFFLTKLIIGWI